MRTVITYNYRVKKIGIYTPVVSCQKIINYELILLSILFNFFEYQPSLQVGIGKIQREKKHSGCQFSRCSGAFKCKEM